MGDEQPRLSALHRLGVLDTEREPQFDELVTLAARVFDTPGALISLVDRDRQWFKASIGLTSTETARDMAFCDRTIRQRAVFLVPDAKQDRRFADNPLVTGEPHIRFYAGAPLVTTDGHAVGSLGVFDSRARTATAYQQAVLLALADQVAMQLEFRATRAAAGNGRAAPGHVGTPREPRHSPAPLLERLLREGSVGYLEFTTAGEIVGVNLMACRMLGYAEAELVGMPLPLFDHPDQVAQSRAAIADLVAGRRESFDAARVFRHSTGREVHVRCTACYVPPLDDRPATIAALLVDLSAQVRADLHRIVAEGDRQLVLDTATDAYVSIDGVGTVHDWNPAAERLFGHRSEQAVGRELAALIVPPELIEAHRQGVGRVAAGATTAMLGRPIEMSALHRDGHRIEVELTVWSAPTEAGGLRFHAFCRDIGERVSSRAALTEANRLLRASREQLNAAFEASPTADAIVDEAGTVVAVNPAMCRFLGQPPEGLVGRLWADTAYVPDRARAESALAAVMSPPGRPVERTEMRFVTTEGRVVWGLASLVPMAGGATSHAAMLRIEDIQAAKELERALAIQASHDAVSGLPNRSLFLERVRQSLEPRQDGAPVGVLVILVEGLGAVIDRSGYAVGDQVLAVVAERMSAGLSDEVTLAHLQPGQFGAVVPGGAQGASRLARLLLDVVREPVDSGGGGVTLRASIGISVATPRPREPASQVGRVVQDAENAARMARREGGDRAVFAAPEFRRAQQQQQRINRLATQALRDGAVDVAYQPVFDLGTGLVVAAEALLRMSDEDGSPLSPLDVVPAAEASGLIVAIGREVLRLAARQAARWQLSHGVLVPVAVNVSAAQLGVPGFPDDVLSAIHLAGAAPEALTLELTESVLVKAGSSGIDQLRALRDAGIRLAIDDFGTGYASLSYLRDLPASTLKIDRSFVEGIPADEGAMAIVAAVIGLAGSFGMTCIAEGLETGAQLDYLAGRGVLGQGNLLGRPGPASAITVALSEQGLGARPTA